MPKHPSQIPPADESTVSQDNIGQRLIEGFYISLLPEKENLKKAAQSLKIFSEKNNLGYEFSLPEQSPDAQSIISWEGARTGFDAEHFEQRYEADCYIWASFDKRHNYNEKTFTQIKAIMLKVWQLLQQEGIQLGYAFARAGDKSFIVQGSLDSPFTYITKASTALYSAKTESEHSVSDDNSIDQLHSLLSNSLEKIEFSFDDLLQQGIELGDILQMQYLRIDYIKAHLKQVKTDIKTYSTNVQTNVGEPLIGRLHTISAAFKKADDKIEFLKNDENAKEFVWIAKHWPRIGDTLSMQNPASKIDDICNDLDQCLDDFSPEDIVKDFNKYLSQLDIATAIADIENIRQSLKENCPEFYSAEIDELIDRAPACTQIILRRMSYLHRVEQALRQESARLDEHAELIPLHEAIKNLKGNDNKTLKNILLKLQGELYLAMQAKIFSRLKDGADKDICELVLAILDKKNQVLESENKVESIKQFEEFAQEMHRLIHADYYEFCSANLLPTDYTSFACYRKHLHNEIIALAQDRVLLNPEQKKRVSDNKLVIEIQCAHFLSNLIEQANQHTNKIKAGLTKYALKKFFLERKALDAKKQAELRPHYLGLNKLDADQIRADKLQRWWNILRYTFIGTLPGLYFRQKSKTLADSVKVNKKYHEGKIKQINQKYKPMINAINDDAKATWLQQQKEKCVTYRGAIEFLQQEPEFKYVNRYVFIALSADIDTVNTQAEQLKGQNAKLEGNELPDLSSKNRAVAQYMEKTMADFDKKRMTKEDEITQYINEHYKDSNEFKLFSAWSRNIEYKKEMPYENLQLFEDINSVFFKDPNLKQRVSAYISLVSSKKYQEYFGNKRSLAWQAEDVSLKAQQMLEDEQMKRIGIGSHFRI